ncbi:GGDEF domain-containing protein [Streptomyces syringium]|uniref:GGDEF domain-containing protein n=1 Tax=Streptomyces syringium TaxID=76729 RepID=UPI003AAD834D
MSEILTAAAAAVPLAAGWSVHGLWLRRRIEVARRDPLTGLLTRDTFTGRARKALARGPRAVLVIDLNRFKEINDTHGHAVGDAVIRATGQRLTRWAADNGGIGARLGGDEFAAVACIYSEDDQHWSLGDLSARLSDPVNVDGNLIAVSASIGAVASDPRTATAGLPELMRRADEAMYRAKRLGAPWLPALGLKPTCATVNGRRAGRPGAVSPAGGVR